MSEIEGTSHASPARASEPRLHRRWHFRLGPLSVWKDVASTVQAVATTVALGAAAWWFIRQGLSAPHVNLTHSIYATKIHPKWELVSLSVQVANVGHVPIRLRYGKAYVQRVLPLDPLIQQ